MSDFRQGPTWPIPPDVFQSRIADLERQLAEAKADNKEMLSVMMAAAVEIKEHWDAHCDAEGYGPANLLRRLETGVTGGGYGYTAETVVDMQAEIEAMRPMVEAADEEASNHCAPDGSTCYCFLCQVVREYRKRKRKQP